MAAERPAAGTGSGIGREALAGAKTDRKARSAAEIRVSRGLRLHTLIIRGTFARPHVRKCLRAPWRELGGCRTRNFWAAAFALADLLEYASRPFFDPAKCVGG